MYGNNRGRFTSSAAELYHGRLTLIDAIDGLYFSHPEIGLSTYDRHSDGSGVCYASRHWPVLNVRPTGRHWNFNLDLFIVDWLEHLPQSSPWSLAHEGSDDECSQASHGEVGPPRPMVVQGAVRFEKRCGGDSDEIDDPPGKHGEHGHGDAEEQGDASTMKACKDAECGHVCRGTGNQECHRSTGGQTLVNGQCRNGGRTRRADVHGDPDQRGEGNLEHARNRANDAMGEHGLAHGGDGHGTYMSS